KNELDTLFTITQLGWDVFQRLQNVGSNNLTLEYFARKVMIKLNNEKCLKDWESVLNNQQSLMEGVCVITNLFNPIGFNKKRDVYDKIDSIVQLLKSETINIDYTNHPEEGIQKYN